jgi:hypothetical protein
MKLLNKLTFVIFALSISCPSWSESDEQQLKTALILNYSHQALFKIATYQDSVVLEEQYSEIINNLDITKIEDLELVQLIQSLLSTLSKHRLNNDLKLLLDKQYEKQIDFALSDYMVQNVLSETQRSFFNPVQAFTNLASAAPTSYMNYRHHMDQLARKHDIDEFLLSQDSILELDAIRKEFLSTYWTLMKRHSIPDKYRVTEAQFEYLNTQIEENDPVVRYRNLSKVIQQYEAYPTALFELAKTAQELGENETAYNYFAQLVESKMPIFRQDDLQAATHMHMVMLTHTKKEKERHIEKMLSEMKLNGRYNLFAGIYFLNEGNNTRAKELFQTNIDNNTMLYSSHKYQVYTAIFSNQEEDYDQEMEKLLNLDSANGQDILYLSTVHPTLRKTTDIMHSVGEVEVVFDEDVFGNTLMNIDVPSKWINDIDHNDAVNVHFGIKKQLASKLDTDDQSHMLSFQLENPVGIDQENTQNGEFSIALSQKKSQLTLDYRFSQVDIKEEGIISSGLDTLGSFGFAESYKDEISQLKEDVTTESKYQVELTKIHLANKCLMKVAENWELCST